jgi:hypothetical protein
VDYIALLSQRPKRKIKYRRITTKFSFLLSFNHHGVPGINIHWAAENSAETVKKKTKGKKRQRKPMLNKKESKKGDKGWNKTTQMRLQ